MQLQSGLFFPLLLLFVVPSNSISESEKKKKKMLHQPRDCLVQGE